MIPLLGAVLGGSAFGSIGSMLVGNSLSQSNAKAQQRAQNYAFQHRHQWETEDLKKAGLNPMLSANQGGSAGSMAMAQAPSTDVGNTINNAAAQSTARSLAKAQEATMKSQAYLNDQLASKASIDAMSSAADVKAKATNNDIQEMELKAILRDPDAHWRTRYQGPLMRKVEDVVSSAKNIYDSVKGDPVAPKGYISPVKTYKRGIPYRR